MKKERARIVTEQKFKQSQRNLKQSRFSKLVNAQKSKFLSVNPALAKV
jgi:hypothetical protein